MLEEDRYVLIGKDGLTTKVHKLFFSIPDEYWFVLVQDDANGDVITIMPFDYHNRWSISDEALYQARQYATMPSFKLPKNVPVQTAHSFGLAPSVWRVSAVVTTDNFSPKTVGICSFPMSLYKTPEDLSKDSLVYKRVREILNQKITSDVRTVSFWARAGKKGDQIPIKLNASR